MALPLTGWGATAIHATVSSAGLYGNGALFITFNGGPIPEPGCDGQYSRIDIPASNPHIKEFFALALTAQTTGRRLYVNVNGCDPQTGRPTLDNSYTAFMYLTD
jgi:hypothetical protein